MTTEQEQAEQRLEGMVTLVGRWQGSDARFFRLTSSIQTLGTARGRSPFARSERGAASEGRGRHV